MRWSHSTVFFVPVLLAALVAVGPGCSRKSSSSATALLYVSDEEGGNVVVVDPVKGTVVTRIAVGKRPRALKLGATASVSMWRYPVLRAQGPESTSRTYRPRTEPPMA